MRLDLLTPILAAPETEVRANFERYGLLDDQVRFLPGWFKDTLHDAPIDRIAVLRLDGDLYESTIQALDALYPRLSPGDFCIIDDYHIPACRQAVTDYRTRHGVSAEIVEIDGCGVLWRK
jgi:O-methyltransferase